MRISEELKRALIVDLEQVLGVKLDDETKQELMRCYEITIGTHEKKFLLTNVDDYEVVVLCEKCGKKYLPHLMKPLIICDECAEELSGKNAKQQTCSRSFSELISEIEHNQKKIVPIRELGVIAGFNYYDFQNVNFDRGTMNPKGIYYISNIKKELETIDNFCAFGFSSDTLSFYYVNKAGKKEHVKNQVLLFQKLREWGFID